MGFHSFLLQQQSGNHLPQAPGAVPGLILKRPIHFALPLSGVGKGIRQRQFP